MRQVHQPDTCFKCHRPFKKGERVVWSQDWDAWCHTHCCPACNSEAEVVRECLVCDVFKESPICGRVETEYFWAYVGPDKDRPATVWCPAIGGKKSGALRAFFEWCRDNGVRRVIFSDVVSPELVVKLRNVRDVFYVESGLCPGEKILCIEVEVRGDE